MAGIFIMHSHTFFVMMACLYQQVCDFEVKRSHPRVVLSAVRQHSQSSMDNELHVHLLRQAYNRIKRIVVLTVRHDEEAAITDHCYVLFCLLMSIRQNCK